MIQYSCDIHTIEGRQYDIKSFFGKDFKAFETKKKEPFYKKKWGIFVTALILIITCFSLLGGDDEDKKTESEKTEMSESESEIERTKYEK